MSILAGLRALLANSTILITGGTGSFGQVFVRRALEQGVRSIRVFSRDELKQSELERELDDPRVRFLLGDVRDRDRLTLAARDVDCVVHAAAQKQVPKCEADPFEAVATNVIGAENVVWAALTNKVPRTIGLSSDKAVNPINTYGATKLCGERIFQQANVYDHTARFAVARYGNVEGSRGSVIPLFRKQAEEGTITITHPSMTRFFISQERMVEFVLESLERMQGGEIFVPKMPARRIMDLAEEIASENGPLVDLKYVGMRPGEKVHETLITSDESHHAREFPDHFAIYPQHRFWEADYPEGQELPEGFRYSSDQSHRTNQDPIRSPLGH